MREVKEYKTEGLKIWGKAKELRANLFQYYLEAPEKGGIRVSGNTPMWFSLVRGLGEDVCVMPGQPYAAAVASRPEISLQATDTIHRAGFDREICAYTRNYWGSMHMDKFILPDGSMIDGFPKPDFIMALSYAPCEIMWHLHVAEYLNVPYYFIDAPAFYPHATERVINYEVEQLLDAIEWMEKITGRRYEDELLIKAVQNECRSYRLWSDMCLLNKNVPAPLDEKTMFSFSLFNALNPWREEVVNFYQELKEEVEDRVKRGIAASPLERARFMTDHIPPWHFMQFWRRMEREYGVVCVASAFNFGVAGCWTLDDEGNFAPYPTPEERGVKITNREEALRAIADFRSHPCSETLYRTTKEDEMLISMARQWKVDAVVNMLNRGCQSGCRGVGARRAYMKEGIPVVSIEYNNADPREFDIGRTERLMDAFLETMGIKKLSRV